MDSGAHVHLPVQPQHLTHPQDLSQNYHLPHEFLQGTRGSFSILALLTETSGSAWIGWQAFSVFPMLSGTDSLTASFKSFVCPSRVMINLGLRKRRHRPCCEWGGRALVLQGLGVAEVCGVATFSSGSAAVKLFLLL